MLTAGNRFAETDLQEDLKQFPFTVVEGPGGGILVELMYEKVCHSTTRDQNKPETDKKCSRMAGIVSPDSSLPSSCWRCSSSI